ncbi:unannotated protein [freshwater metagenome]|uniref:Unannotated protein n=1 Tax=freshwater metagenome TaxID=449393 RepID=A0A6J7XTW9_9ZZZZ
MELRAHVGQDENMVSTTGGFTSAQLALEAQTLVLASLSHADALTIGEIAAAFGRERNLPITIEIRLGEWIVFHISLPGSVQEHDQWIARKAAVLLAKGNSTMFERVFAEEQGYDWYEHNHLPEEHYAIHGGGIPLNVSEEGMVGALLISGLPQVEDHLLGVEVIAEFLARKGEEL